jgi:hypothetical protein
MIIFPTRAKSKLPPELCFPLGAQSISSQFQDVPQIEMLSITFDYYNRSFNDLTPDGFRRLIQVGYGYRRSNQYTPVSDPLHFYDQPNWEISVLPVYREEKPRVLEPLETQAFPRVHRWLIFNDSLTGQETSVAFKVLWHPEREILAFEEANRFEIRRV